MNATEHNENRKQSLIKVEQKGKYVQLYTMKTFFFPLVGGERKRKHKGKTTET